MNYKQLIDEVESISLSHNLVNSFVEGDNIYDLNSSDNLYPVIYLTSKPHQLSQPTSKYNFYIYYVDRLIENKSNRIFVQSAGIKAINDIILKVKELTSTDIEYPIALTPFTEKFSDECAGIYGEIVIETFNDNTECNIMNYTVGIISEEGEQLITENDENIVIEGN